MCKNVRENDGSVTLTAVKTDAADPRMRRRDLFSLFLCKCWVENDKNEPPAPKACSIHSYLTLLGWEMPTNKKCRRHVYLLLGLLY